MTVILKRCARWNFGNLVTIEHGTRYSAASKGSSRSPGKSDTLIQRQQLRIVVSGLGRSPERSSKAMFIKDLAAVNPSFVGAS